MLINYFISLVRKIRTPVVLEFKAMEERETAQLMFRFDSENETNSFNSTILSIDSKLCKHCFRGISENFIIIIFKLNSLNLGTLYYKMKHIQADIIIYI